MASLISAQWLKLHDIKTSLFRQQHCETVLAVKDEATFRDYFETICMQNRESDRTTLLARLQRSFRKLTSFRNTLDNMASAKGMHRPSELLWGACYAVVESGYTSFGKEYKDPNCLEGLVDLLCELSGSVPVFTSVEPYWRSEPSIQKPLQEIFACFIDTCLFLVSYLRGLELDGIYQFLPQISSRQYIQGSANVMAIAKAFLDIAVNDTSSERDLCTGALSKASSMPAFLDYTIQHPSDQRATWTHIKHLGHGGQGDVSKVQERASGRQFARKAMRFTIAIDPVREDEERERRETVVREEVMIMQKLRHVHIAAVLFTVRERESFDFIMLPVADKDLHAFFEDCTMKHYLAAKGDLLPRWMGCLVNALEFAHDQSIRHKDIKPRNILVKGDQVILTDFGLAIDFTTAEVSYTTDSFRGTFHYKAPESSAGIPHGRAADIFSLGCVFSEMLTVYRGKPLSKFDQKRKGRLSSEGNAFHLNLSEVTEWVSSLMGDDLSDFLAEMILNMVEEEALQRRKARELKALVKERDKLGCDCCRSG